MTFEGNMVQGGQAIVEKVRRRGGRRNEAERSKAGPMECKT